MLKYLEDALHLLYPRICMACFENTSEKPNVFCVKCIMDIQYTNHFEDQNNTFFQHFRGRVDLVYGAALIYFSEGSVVQKMMHNFKYESKKEIGTVLGRIAGEKIEDSIFFKNLDIIVPVPLHYKKQLRRGYNQSAVFGQAISEKTGIPIVIDNLVKVKETDSQTSKNRTERQINIRDSFNIQNERKFANKHVLIVDDVVTTGATIEACSGILLKIGASKISVLSMAEAT